MKDLGSVPKWSEAKTGAVAMGAVLAILLVMFSISAVRKSAAAKQAAETAREETYQKAQRKKERETFLQNQADRAAGIVSNPTSEPEPEKPISAGTTLGYAAGHLQGLLGKPYPFDAVIDQAARTLAVKSGHSPNNWIFKSEFKRTFEEGYRDGSAKYRSEQ